MVLFGVAVAAKAALCTGVTVCSNMAKGPAVRALAEFGLVNPSLSGDRGTKHEELSFEDLLDQGAIWIFKGESDRGFKALDLVRRADPRGDLGDGELGDNRHVGEGSEQVFVGEYRPIGDLPGKDAGQDNFRPPGITGDGVFWVKVKGLPDGREVYSDEFWICRGRECEDKVARRVPVCADDPEAFCGGDGAELFVDLFRQDEGQWTSVCRRRGAFVADYKPDGGGRFAWNRFGGFGGSGTLRGRTGSSSSVR